jgi:hypothetical protein
MRAMALKVLILVLALAGFAWADEEDEPGRGVARVSLINGDVSVRRGDSGDWVAAAVNAPLVVNDQLLTGAGSRAELQFDWANMIRLSSDAEIHLAELENQRYMIQVARGLVTFHVERDSDAEVEISTPSVSVRPLGKGSYRILVREDGESEITVRSGEADVFTPRGSERLRSGKTMLARGSASDPEYRIVSAAAYDNWDRWNEDRDRYYARTNSYQYVDRSVYGVEDLDGYGAWIDVTPYGWVWSPRVAVDWAPYSYGRWSWVDWYGWSWVSYDPWGWAPFHYGRWFYSSPHGWCWFPGALRARHYWSPGLVAFFGWGNWSGLHAEAGMGHLGWVPLAPYETYHPWYGRSYYHGYGNSTYIDNSVHIVNNTNIVNIYRNARITNAVAAVDASQFGRGNMNLVRVSANDMHRVDLVRGQVPVVPGRESLRVSNREVRATPQPRAAANERFFSRRQPAQVERVPFEQQRRGMEQVARRTFGEPAPVRRVEPAPQSAAQDRGSSQGWRRLGEPTARPEVQTNSAPPNEPGSWRRFEGVRDSGDSVRAPQPSVPRVTERESPRYTAPAPRSETPRVAPSRNEAPIRISPLIVRERQAPRSEAPRVSEPRAAGAVREAPRSGGRVSGGEARSGGRSR